MTEARSIVAHSAMAAATVWFLGSKVFHMLIGPGVLPALIQNFRCDWWCFFATPQNVEEILDRFHVETAHPDNPPLYSKIACPMNRNRLHFRLAVLPTDHRCAAGERLVASLRTPYEQVVPKTDRGLVNRSVISILLIGMMCLFSGCGTTQERQATEQLLLSDAVDRSVSTIDFRPLTGEKVYLDTSYLRSAKVPTIVNADYVTSALRQQVMAAGCYLQDSASEADIIIEARIGTLGYDDHRVTLGVPENNAINSTVSLLPSSPSVPQIPEIAIARRDAREGAAKVAAFAYDRKTREAIWQSGISRSRSTARDTWVMGVGPFQGGSIREETRLAGTKLLRFGRRSTGSPPKVFSRPPVDYTAETRFDGGYPVLGDENQSMIGGGLLPGEPLPSVTATEMLAKDESASESEGDKEASGEPTSKEAQPAEKIAAPPIKKKLR
ncbi:DUF6655 family protein [Rhodopirellula bahusiensis]|uniref:DUF6655 family protein n=1 Tax=Rhodopirellula bahusiensis TaxID=2014065 RepID=UPI003263596A